MLGKLSVLMRTKSEIEIYGGDVYIDIDGKNVGIVKNQHLHFDLPQGMHTIKMYKSHTMGTFIGFAETQIEISDNENLCLRYAAPMMTNMSGNIIVTSYDAPWELDSMVDSIEKEIGSDVANIANKQQKQQKDIKNHMKWWVILAILVPVISGIIYVIMWQMAVLEILDLSNSLFSSIGMSLLN